MTITRMALAVWLTAAVSHGRETVQQITINVRYGSNDRLRIGSLAQYLATRMFSDAGISVRWNGRESGGGGSPPPIVIDVADETRPELMPGALAYSELCRGRITVFLDRVERLENPAIVLAHVLVHEITHVAQGIRRHSESGVMKARWTARDYSEMRRRPLGFAPEDLELIRERLSRPRVVAGAPGANEDAIESDSAGR